MQNVKYIIISSLMFFLFTVSVNAQQNDDAYQFPVKPGMSEWKKLKTHDDMLKNVQIPLDIKKGISTKSLLLTCLSYPLFIDMWAYNNIKDGFEQVKKDFNGFDELFQRKDAFIEIIKLYKSMDPEIINKKSSLLDKGKYSTEYCKIEIILAHPDLMNTLSQHQKEIILDEVIIKKNQMLNYVEYDIKNIETNTYLTGRTMVQLDNKMKQGVNKKTNIFIETSSLIDNDIIIEIGSYAKNYLKNKY